MISIIIVNYNTRETISRCIGSIFDNCENSDYEIIVVDNNSKDNSIGFLQNNFRDKIKFIANQSNKGFGAGNNQGAEMARGEYLFFLNSDTLINDDILKEIKNYLINNEEVGILAPLLKSENGSPQPDSCGKYPTITSVIFNKIKTNSNYPKRELPVGWVSGAALIIRKNLFSRLKGFDEDFFMYFEDIDLCKRANDLGYKIKVFPKISVIHLGGASFDNLNKKKKLYYKSQDYFFKKYYGVFAMYIMKALRWPHKTLVLILNK